MSGILLHLIRNHFLGPQGMWIAGAPIEIDGNITMLFAKFANQLADGDGWKQTLQAKNAAAIRGCPKCKNIVSHKSGLSGHGAGVRDITCARPQDFQLHTRGTIFNDIAALFGYQAQYLGGTMTKTLLLEYEKAFGFTRPWKVFGAIAKQRGSSSHKNRLLLIGPIAPCRTGGWRGNSLPIVGRPAMNQPLKAWTRSWTKTGHGLPARQFPKRYQSQCGP